MLSQKSNIDSFSDPFCLQKIRQESIKFLVYLKCLNQPYKKWSLLKLCIQTVNVTVYENLMFKNTFSFELFISHMKVFKTKSIYIFHSKWKLFFMIIYDFYNPLLQIFRVTISRKTNYGTSRLHRQLSKQYSCVGKKKPDKNTILIVMIRTRILNSVNSTMLQCGQFPALNLKAVSYKNDVAF